MQSGACTLLGLLVVLSVSGTTIALECYFCNGEHCADPFNTTNAVTATCSSGEMCAIWVRRSDISRQCLPVSTCQLGDDFFSHGGSCCDSNLCNGGPAPTPQPTQPTPQPTQPTQPPPDDSDAVSCYSCEYRSDTGGSSACMEEPFNTSGPGVSQMTCIGSCVVANHSDNGVTHLSRTCSATDGPSPCVPGCHPPPLDVCATCCSEDLCNSGPVPSPDQQPPPQTQPPTSPSTTGQAATLAPKLKSAVALMAALAMLAM